MIPSQHYHSLGYSVVPIIPNDKACKIDQWNILDRDHLLNNFLPEHGVGIRLDNGLGAIDVDVYHADTCKLVRDFIDMQIGVQPYRIGEAPKFMIVVRCPEITSKFTSAKYRDHNGTINAIEFLAGSGCQFVVDHIHPDTGLPYTWHRGELCAADDIITIPVSIIHAVISYFESLADGLGWTRIINTRPSAVLTPEQQTYNSLYNIGDLLVNYGWKRHGDKFTRPGKRTGTSGTLSGNTFYCFTSGTELVENTVLRPYDIVLAYSFNGDTAAMSSYVSDVILGSVRSAGFGDDTVIDDIPSVTASTDPADRHTLPVSEIEQYILTAGVTAGSESSAKTELIKYCVSKTDLKDGMNVEIVCQRLREITGMSIGVIRSEFKSTTSTGYSPELTSALNEINKNHSCIIIGNKFRIMEEYTDQSTQKPTRRFLSRYDFTAYYANRIFYLNDKPLTLGDIWLGEGERPTYHDLVFDPTMKANHDTYNMYKGLAVTPKQGDWSLMNDHIMFVVCAGDPELYKYVRMWIARCIQFPGGDRPGVALVFRGDKGTGKGTVANWLQDIFGDHFIAAADAQRIVGRFNSLMADRIMCFADEAFFAGDKSQDGKLKSLITEPYQVIERKGVDEIVIKNHLNVLMASNADFVVPATKGERRYAVLDMSNIHRKDIPYFKALRKQQMNGGIEAMVYDLMQDEIDMAYLRCPPVTEALREQVSQNMNSVEGFWSECMSREYIMRNHLNGGEIPFEDSILRNDVFRSYQQYCRDCSERYPLGYESFFRMTYGDKGIFPNYKQRMTVRVDGKRMFRSSPLDEMKLMFEEYMS